MNKRIVILGPTATGKSDVGVCLAKKFGGEIISADSRQVYTGLDIGTGKIPKREMHGVHHHLLDIANPKKQFSVSDYQKHAEKVIRSIYKNKHVPIIVGGTGLYIDAITKDTTFPAVPPNHALRKKLGKKSAAQLFAMLKKKDPARAKTIDSKNPRRLIRALEIIEVLGKVPRSSTQKRDDVLYIGLMLSPDKLRLKIKQRIALRMKQGMVAEARTLHARGLSYKRMRELGLEYRFLADLLEKRNTKSEFLEQLATAIWQYSRRQMTWFKKNKDIVWFNPKEMGRIEKKVMTFLKA
ncbi:MAG: tRNA (adenosine(37)-N6)-dimethylallyltransferase MiaA [Patescibacteria group bacterium]